MLLIRRSISHGNVFILSHRFILTPRTCRREILTEWLPEIVTIKPYMLSKKADLDWEKCPPMSLLCGSPGFVCCAAPGLNGQTLPPSCADCSKQLHYQSSMSAIFYCYLLIGGIGKGIFHQGCAIPFFSALKRRWREWPPPLRDFTWSHNFNRLWTLIHWAHIRFSDMMLLLLRIGKVIIFLD